VSLNARPRILRQLASYRLIYLYDQKQNFEGAANEARLFIRNHSYSFLLEDVYISLARFYELLGQYDMAEATYLRILELFPDTRFAQEYLQKLGIQEDVD
ncbi:MAG: tetratricopeptide repeat protein, partial [Elusimicrobia bacterium]|nr:tetratricopeptide repeat protein [Elusimicrobiota bacterium]